MHKIHKLIKQIDKTHKGLGAMIAMNLICAKAKLLILNVAPAGCGKSVSTDAITLMIGQTAHKYTSLTLAGLKNITKELDQFNGHITIDDLGSEKSRNHHLNTPRAADLRDANCQTNSARQFCLTCSWQRAKVSIFYSQSEWSRVSTVTVLATLVHTHYVKKVTQSYVMELTNFYGSASLNIQPILMQSICGDNDWIAVIRDKALRYYHLIRPTNPKPMTSVPTIDYSIPLQETGLTPYKGKLWYQLVAIALTQWSYGRVIEHLPKLLRASAALDGRVHTQIEDYRLLAKLMKPMQLERTIITSFGFESGRLFDNNTYCLLVELASHGHPTIETICEDYKVSPSTVERLAQSAPEWCWVKSNSPRRLMPTEQTEKIFKTIGVNQKW